MSQSGDVIVGGGGVTIVAGLPLNGGGGGGSATLAGLSDVSVAGAVNGQVLTYNGTLWVAQTPSGGGGGGVPTSRQIISGTGLSGGGDLSTNRTLAVVFGTTAGTVCQGDDARLSDARTPLAHTHAASEVTSGTFAIGRIPVGTTAGTVAAGDDARLSDARTPLAHTHTASQISDSTATGRAVLTAVDQAAGRAAISAAAATHTHTAADVTGGVFDLARIPSGIAHSGLAGLTAGDPHTQYVSLAPAASTTRNIVVVGAGGRGLDLRMADTTDTAVQISNAGGTAQVLITAENGVDCTGGGGGFTGSFGQFSSTVTTGASTTAAASLVLPHGTAPTTPPNGAVWTTTAGMFVRVNGSTVGPLGTGGGGGAPTTAQYVTLATDGTLTNERVLTGGNAISLTDAGAGGAVTVAVDLVEMTTPNISDVAFDDQTLLLDTSAPSSQSATVRDILNNPRRRVILFEDFTGLNANVGWLRQTNFGSGSSVSTTAASANAMGVMRVTSGTTTSSSAAVFSSDSSILFNGASYDLTVRMIPFNVASDATDTFVVRSGFGDADFDDPGDGVFFRYTHGTNGGRWQCVTSSNFSSGWTDSGVAPVANTWTTLRVVVNAGATSADFYIDGTLVATRTTQIPSGTGRQTGIMPLVHRKTAGTLSRTSDLDYVNLAVEFANLR